MALLPSLVGRDRELAILRERLAAALAGQGGLVLIGGEAGIGKTPLRRRFAGKLPTSARWCWSGGVMT